MTHYKVEPFSLSNKPAAQWADYFEYGSYYLDEFVLIPISKIKFKKWNQGRYDFYMDRFQKGGAAQPVRLSLKEDGMYEVGDGNHRIAVSEALGYTHIPAIVSRKVEGKPEGSPPRDLYEEVYGRELMYTLTNIRAHIDSPHLLLEWGGVSKTGYWLRVSDESEDPATVGELRVAVNGDSRTAECEWKGVPFRYRGDAEGLKRKFTAFLNDYVRRERRVARIAGTLSREAQIARKVVSGLFEPPPKMVQDISSWVVGVLAYGAKMRLEWKIKDYQGHKDWTGFDPKNMKKIPGFVNLGDLDYLEKMSVEEFISRMKSDADRLSGYISASSIPVKLVVKNWKKAFRIDLTGWKYLPKFESASPENRKKAKEVFPSVLVEIDMRENERNASAAWFRNQRRLVVYVDRDFHGARLIDDAADVITEITRSVAHELRHFCQDYLRLLVGAYDSAGYPSSDIRNPDVDQNLSRERKTVLDSVQKKIDKLKQVGITPDIFHDLDDAEFYTELAGVIEMIPKDIAASTHEDKRAVLLSLMDAGPKIKGAPPYKFMKSLHKFAPGKWQKAVSEIVKMVL